MSEADAEKGGGLSLGEYLKGVRESRGVELDEASRVTKVSKSYLAAIEQGEYDRLPSAAYIKGFLRLYAGYLGLSGDEVISRYESALPQAARPPAEPKPERPGVEMMERSKARDSGRWVIPVLLLVLVVLAAIFLTDHPEEPERPAPQAPQSQQPQQSEPAPPAAPAAAPVLPPRTSASAPSAAPAPADAPLEATQAGEGGLVLRLRFNQDTWLSITIDDSISQRYELKAGDIIEWKGTRGFVLDVGDGGGVEGEFNGRPLKALGEPGKPAHVELKKE